MVNSVTGHGNDLALSLFLLDDSDLILRLAFRHKAIHTGFPGNGRGGKRVITGAHDRLDADGTQPLKALLHSRLDGILQVDDTQNLVVLTNRQRGAAQAGNFGNLFPQVRGYLATQF